MTQGKNKQWSPAFFKLKTDITIAHIDVLKASAGEAFNRGDFISFKACVKQLQAALMRSNVGRDCQERAYNALMELRTSMQPNWGKSFNAEERRSALAIMNIQEDAFEYSRRQQRPDLTVDITLTKNC